MDLKLGLPYVNRNAHPGYIFKFDSISVYFVLRFWSIINTMTPSL